MLDRFKKEFEGIWPRCRLVFSSSFCAWKVFLELFIFFPSHFVLKMYFWCCFIFFPSHFVLEKYFWSAPNRSGEQGTVTEGEMVGCIIGLSTLSATKPLKISKYWEYFGV